MERMRPLFALQKQARWLSALVAFVVLIGLAALFPTAQRALAGRDERPGTSMSAVDLEVVLLPPGLLPSTAPSQTESPTTVQSPRSAQPYQVENPSAYIYTVRLGEYWIGIATRFGISYNDLRTANPDLWSLRHEVIHPGDQMIIPGLSAEQMGLPVNYVVQPGDSWYKIASTFGVLYWDLRLDNLKLWHQRGIYIRPGDAVVVNGAQIVLSSERSVDAAVDSEIAAETESESTEASTSGANTLPSSNTGAPILAGNVPADASVYTVRPGDTWYGIAAAYGIPFESLRSANPTLWSARGQRIRPADQMIIPAHGSPPPPPEIRTAPGDEAGPTPEAVEEEATPDAEATAPAAEATVTPIAEESTPVEDDATTGPMQPATPEGTRLRIELAQPALTYIVQAGEDWAAVAGKAGVSVDDLKAANPALSGRELQSGDTVLLP
jgi:LysM repeat protein